MVKFRGLYHNIDAYNIVKVTSLFLEKTVIPVIQRCSQQKLLSEVILKKAVLKMFAKFARKIPLSESIFLENTYEELLTDLTVLL